MAGRLHRLIYCSRYDIAESDLDEVVGDIIRTSIRNNRASDITGMLLVHGGFFVQALEGPVETVLTTYDRICSDPRHRDTKVLCAGPADRRAFGDWNMCAQRVTPSDDAILETLSQRTPFAPDKLQGEHALRLLTTFRRIQADTQRRALA